MAEEIVNTQKVLAWGESIIIVENHWRNISSIK